MTGTTPNYSLDYPQLADVPPDISAVGTLATQIDTALKQLDASDAVKARVQAVATTNINLASPGANIDTVAMSAGDLMLLTGQTSASENGVWKWNGAGAAATRPPGFTSGSGTGAVKGGHMVTGGLAGPNGGIWVNTNTGAITVNTTGLNYTKIFTTSGLYIPDGSIVKANLADAIKPSGTAAAGDEALRALGTTASTAAAGNDSRLSDNRPPTDGSVTNVKLGANSTVLVGTLAARPAANSLVAGTLYFATNDNSGTLYRTNGATWVAVAAPVVVPAGQVDSNLRYALPTWSKAIKIPGGTAAGTYYVKPDGTLTTNHWDIDIFQIPRPSISGGSYIRIIGNADINGVSNGGNADLQLAQVTANGTGTGATTYSTSITARGTVCSVTMNHGAASSPAADTLDTTNFPQSGPGYAMRVVLAGTTPATNAAIVQATVWVYP